MFQPSYRCRLLLLPLLLVGCREKPATVKPTAPERRQHYAELGGLRRSQDPELQTELARLRAEQSLPLQLDALRRGKPADEPATGDNGEAGSRDPFAPIFPHFTRRSLTEQVDALFPRGDFVLGPAELNAARMILRRNAQALERFSQTLPGDEGFGIPFRDGLLARLDLLDGAMLGARLEGLRAADALADHSPQTSLESLTVALRTARLLADEGRMTARLAGAKVRGEGLRLALTIARRPDADPNTVRRLVELLQAQLVSWPSDARVCIGDRAVGLHTFELVRDGYFLSLLDEEETKSLQARNILLVTGKTALRNVDADELFYLRTMRRLIESCETPYFAREADLVALRRELESRRNTPEFPLVSGMILLTDFEEAQRRLAEDLARTQAVLIALQKAIGGEPTAIDLNPLTGKPYRLEIAAGRVTVSDVFERQSDEPISLPLVRSTTSLSR